MEALLALQSSLHWLAVFCSAIADCDKASSPTNTAHTAKVGFITHISGKTPPTPTASRRQRRREGNCRVGSRIVVRIPCPPASYCCFFVPTMTRTKSKHGGERKNGGAAGRRRRLQVGSPRRQCAVSVEESASTAGSVVTEVSVGLAFS